MWIVAVDTDFYPDVEEFDTYEKAKDYYDKQVLASNVKIYIAKVEESKEK